METTDPALGSQLVALARAAIAKRLGVPHDTPAAAHPALAQPGATFVTLTQAGVLRGCIGQLEPSRALRRDVEENALGAAFRDPRFPALTAPEWPLTQVEVSLLGPVTLSECPTLAQCLALIVPGQDGVILSSGCNRATFLPQVWEQLPEPRQFIAQLMAKAGLRAWPEDMQLGTYRVHKYREH